MKSGMNYVIGSLLALSLAAMVGCGGNSTAAPTYRLGGTISGLTSTGLVLQNNGGSDLQVSANAASFTFPSPVKENTPYSVTVLSQPAGETCSVSNASGAITSNVTYVSVNCAQLLTVSGTINGLTGSGLVLQNNGGDNLAVDAKATSFTFPTPVVSGKSYNVSILRQPSNQNCTISAATGSATANVANVSISCQGAYSITGTITGLERQGLVLQDSGGDNITLSANATTFAFPTAVNSGSTFNVTVLSQPLDQSCSVSNGSGTASTAVGNISVVCVGDWVWEGGSSTIGLNGGQPGIYGTLGTADAANIPGGREQPVTWKDSSGNVYLFGGSGHDAAGTRGLLNDLWKFNPKQGSAGEWTWIGGSNKVAAPISATDAYGQPGVYGTLGVAAPTNVPGGREQSVSWLDAGGKLWLFGGIGVDAVGTYADLNDLWKFDPALGTNGEWTWMGGSSVAPPILYNQGVGGSYGTLGVASPSNAPGARYGALAWADTSGALYLFGGNGFDASSANGYLNDLWKYVPGAQGAAGAWTWVAGSATVPPSQGPFGGSPSAQPGVYGTLGLPSASNLPGGRGSANTWTDASGNFWLFGGLGADSGGTVGYLNDLWKFVPSQGQWTWMGGSNVVPGTYLGQPGIYGVAGVGSPSNAPGGRFSPTTWVDAAGNLWLFGGQGFDWTGTAGYLNDLWRFNPTAKGNSGEWTWMAGSESVPPAPLNQGLNYGQPGIYGMLGVGAPANVSGGRFGAAGWTDSSGSLVLFGGQGTDSTGSEGYLNDLWQYRP